MYTGVMVSFSHNDKILISNKSKLTNLFDLSVLYTYALISIELCTFSAEHAALLFTCVHFDLDIGDTLCHEQQLCKVSCQSRETNNKDRHNLIRLIPIYTPFKLCWRGYNEVRCILACMTKFH